MTLKATYQFNKKRVLIGIWSIVAMGWLLLATSLVFTVSKPIFIGIVTFVAVSTEGAFWLTSLILGVAIIDARKAIITKIKTAFQADKSLY